MNNVPVSIFYSLRDNSTGMTGLWGVLRNNYTPKESYQAVQVLVNNLGGYTYVNRVSTASQSDFVLRFQNFGTGHVKFVAWTIGAAHTIPLQTGGTTKTTNYLGVNTILNAGPNGFIQLPLNSIPRYIELP